MTVETSSATAWPWCASSLASPLLPLQCVWGIVVVEDTSTHLQGSSWGKEFLFTKILCKWPSEVTVYPYHKNIPKAQSFHTCTWLWRWCPLGHTQHFFSVKHGRLSWYQTGSFWCHVTKPSPNYCLLVNFKRPVHLPSWPARFQSITV